MVIRKCVFLNVANKDITFCWVHSHVGIRGNEKADAAPKSALDLPRVKVGVPNTDFKHHINQYILSTGQDDWNGAVAVLGDWQTSYKQCRKDEVVLCRLYYLRKDPPPQCEHCQCILTVRHILVERDNCAEKKKGYIW